MTIRSIRSCTAELDITAAAAASVISLWR
jgi:hypothetical protein